jgi:hypothetical protein
VDASGLERGDGVRGGLETEFRGLKKFVCVVKVGRSLERRRPRAAAEGDDAAGVGIGICSSGGSRGAIFDLCP